MTIMNMAGSGGGLSKQEYMDVTTVLPSSNPPRFISGNRYAAGTVSYGISSYRARRYLNGFVVRGDEPYLGKYNYSMTDGAMTGYETNAISSDTILFPSVTASWTPPTDAVKGTITGFFGVTYSSSSYQTFVTSPQNLTYVDIPFYTNDSGVLSYDYTELKKLTYGDIFSSGNRLYSNYSNQTIQPAIFISSIEYEAE